MLTCRMLHVRFNSAGASVTGYYVVSCHSLPCDKCRSLFKLELDRLSPAGKALLNIAGSPKTRMQQELSYVASSPARPP